MALFLKLCQSLSRVLSTPCFATLPTELELTAQAFARERYIITTIPTLPTPHENCSLASSAKGSESASHGPICLSSVILTFSDGSRKHVSVPDGSRSVLLLHGENLTRKEWPLGVAKDFVALQNGYFLLVRGKKDSFTR